MVFDFAGPRADWGTTWWPHVKSADDIIIEGKTVSAYSFLRDSAETFIHEFGHILGAEDYYSHYENHTNMFMSYAMMCDNTGDHDGFTKWSYGWLSDEDIAFVDKETGATTVSLAPIETPLGYGKKIAVVSPKLDPSKGFFDEFFVVEYDSGTGNNADVFESYSFEPGFRIFHVRAEAEFDDEEQRVKYIMSNDLVRDNLIHNIKTETISPNLCYQYDNFFREGDSLTVNGYPNTGFASEEIYNGLFTGISFTDFVTGENPSFKVSFSDTHEQKSDVDFTLICNELESKISLTLKGDLPTVLRNAKLPKNYKYAPYLIDADGNKLILDIESINNSVFDYSLSYNRPEPTVQPNTEYTLVIPEGLFVTGYDQDVPEYRATIKTSHFLALNIIAGLDAEGDQKVRSNVFTVTDNTFGIIRVPYGNNGKSEFIEYNLNGEELDQTEFELPFLYPEGRTSDKILACKAYRLNDGNFALDIPLIDSDSFVKIDRNGNALSKVYNVSEDFTKEYTDSLYNIRYSPYKGGLCKKFESADGLKNTLFTIDFENEPQLIDNGKSYRYINLDEDLYAIVIYGTDRSIYLYDKEDKLNGKISIEDKGYLLSVLEDNGSVKLVYSVYDIKTDTTKVFVEAYSKSGELLDKTEVTENILHIGDYGFWNRGYANKDGYFLVCDGESNCDLQSTIIAYDREWNYLGVINTDNFTNFTLLGACGVTQTSDYSSGSHLDVISRFNIGDFEIVQNPEEATEPATADTEPATASTEPSTVEPSEAATEPTTEPATVQKQAVQPTTVQKQDMKPTSAPAEKTSATGSVITKTTDNGAVQTGQSSLAVLLLAMLPAAFALCMYFYRYKYKR